MSSSELVSKFICESIVTIFGYPLALISDQGTHFLNKIISTLLEEFMTDHPKTSAYHPQENRVIKGFNKTDTKFLIKICSIDKDGWDDKIPVFLWAYRITYKW